jgi:hypothetical protein
MIMIIHFPDDSWIYGERKWWFFLKETKGTHHFIVLNASRELKETIGQKVAIPINSAKFFILDANKELKDD